MNVIQKAELLLQVVRWRENRGIGNTRNAIELVKKVNGKLLTFNVAFAGGLDVDFIPLSSSRLDSYFLSDKKPLVVDHHTWDTLVSGLLLEIKDIKEQNRKLTNALSTIKQIREGFYDY